MKLDGVGWSSWSRGIENTVNISSLQMPGCRFSVSGAIGDGRARGQVCGGSVEGVRVC